MQTLSTTERTDALAGFSLLAALAYKFSLQPGSTLAYSILGAASTVWFMVRLVRHINNPANRGLLKLWGMVLHLGLLFNSGALLFNAMGWRGADNASALGILTGLGYIGWFRLPNQPWRSAPHRATAYVAPILLLVSACVWLMPAEARFRAFNPASKRVTYADYKKGYRLQGGTLVDSAGHPADSLATKPTAQP